jgi:hypothetical protein
MLRQTRPWVMFLSILAFIGCAGIAAIVIIGLYVLVFVGAIVFSVAAGLGKV